MKAKMILLLLVMVCLASTGCQEYAAGTATGATAMAALLEDSQNDFIEAVNALNEETAKINDAITEVEGAVLVKPETLEALEELKERGKDPITWIAAVSILANVFGIGRASTKKKIVPA